MDFEQFTELVTNSAAENGYVNFFPSLCIVADKLRMNVLDVTLEPDGDEEAAKEWASDFIDQSQVAYLAYRSGDRTISIAELTGYEVTRKTTLKMVPYTE